MQIVRAPRAFNGLLAVIAGMSCGILGCNQHDASRPTSQANKNQPVHLSDLDGRPFDLWKSDKPAIAVVVFTRTDCPIANRYAPEIRRLCERFESRGVEFYLVYVDPRQSADDIRRHLHEFEYPCPGLRDPEHTFVAHCRATVTPEAVVFDKNRAITYMGRIDDRYVDVGKPRAEPTAHDLADAIESTVLGRPISQPRTKAIGCLIADLKN